MLKPFQNFLEKHSHRVFGLDLLRAIAILTVVYGHARVYVPIVDRPLYDQWLLIPIDGVSIFFVLSGFLIGGILLRRLDGSAFKFTDLWLFWLRRWFRTIPNYLLVLSLLLAYRIFILNDLWDFSPWYYLFSQNLFSPHPAFFPEAWSLSVEEWFYLLFPLVIYGALRWMPHKNAVFLGTVLAFTIIPLLLRIWKYEYASYSGTFDEEFRKIVILRLDSLMLGIIAAYVKMQHPKIWRQMAQPGLYLGLLTLLLLYWNPGNWRHFYRPLDFNIEGLATLLFLPFLAEWKKQSRAWIALPILFISLTSYSLYLLHLSVVQAHIIPILGAKLEVNLFSTETGSWLLYSFYWLICLGLSALQYRFFEKPILKLRERFS